MSLEELIGRVGLPAVFAGAAAEGDLSPFLSGVVAHLGLLPLGAVVVVATLGMLAGDLVWYGIGRHRHELLRGSAAYRRSLGVVESYVDKVGAAQLLMARVIYGTRIMSMIYWGARRLPIGRFLAIDLLGCTLWATLLSLLGYFLSNQAAQILGEIKAVERWLLGALVVGLIGVALHLALGRRRLARRRSPG